MTWDPNKYGFNDQQAVDFLTDPGNKGKVAGMADEFGFDSNSLTDWWNKQGLSTQTAQGVSDYFGLPAPAEAPNTGLPAPAEAAPSFTVPETKIPSATPTWSPTDYGYTDQQAIDFFIDPANKDRVAGMMGDFGLDSAKLSGWAQTLGLDVSSADVQEYFGLPDPTSPETPVMPAVPVTPDTPSSLADTLGEHGLNGLDFYKWATTPGLTDSDFAKTFSRWKFTDADELARIYNLGMAEAGVNDPGQMITGQMIRDRTASFLPADYWGGRNDGEIKDPGSIDNHKNLNDRLPGYFDQLEQGIPNYFEAFEQFKGLPGMIDELAENRINQGRVTGDDVKSVINSVNNQRYSRGLPTGTEAQETMARLQGGLVRGEQERRDGILKDAATQKFTAISQLPGQALLPTQLLNNFYGISASESQGWGGIYADMINSMY